MLTPKSENEVGIEKVFVKLGKSIIANENLNVGDKLTIDNLSGRIFNEQFIPVRESNQILGKILNRKIKEGDPIFYNDIEDL
jgi:N-acetylneuraminate synthase/sialic acid synthase